MDLLGSILSTMDKPPSIGGKQKEIAKQQREEFIKKQEEEKEKLKKFRGKIEADIAKFIQDSSVRNYKFVPMVKIHRSIVHDVVDVAGLTAFSFGEEEVDRYVMIFKKEYAPSDEELLAYRRGEEWNPEKAKEVMRQKELALKLEEKETAQNCNVNFIPNSNYRDKYEKLIGKESAKEAARIAQPNKNFGFVPSENKRDQRTIEQALNDIRTKKKLKINHPDESDVAATQPDDPGIAATLPVDNPV